MNVFQLCRPICRGIQGVQLNHIVLLVSVDMFTPHMHTQAGGYVIGAGVHIYIYVCERKKIESYFSD